MNIRLKRYQKEFQHSYSFGVYSTLELLAHRHGYVEQVLLSTKGERSGGVGKLQNECVSRGIATEFNDAAIERLSPRESHLAVGVFRKYVAPLEPDHNHVVLVNPGDMGNLGTIARTMVAFGLTDLALIRPAADLMDPRAVRASMGALFQLSYQYFDDFQSYQSAFGHRAYPLMTDGESLLSEAQFTSPFALVFGSEASGLSVDFRAVGSSIRIPQGNDVDSLNLSVAVGIVLYASSAATA